MPELTEYEAEVLEELLLLGRTTTPDLAEATGIPKARIYGVLNELCAVGFVKLIPGRPRQYEPHEPTEVVDRAIENQRHTHKQFHTEVESVKGSFVDTHTLVRDRGIDELSPTEDLFHVVDVGLARE